MIPVACWLCNAGQHFLCLHGPRKAHAVAAWSDQKAQKGAQSSRAEAGTSQPVPCPSVGPKQESAATAAIAPEQVQVLKPGRSGVHHQTIWYPP